jgi:hypothetical protein
MTGVPSDFVFISCVHKNPNCVAAPLESICAEKLKKKIKNEK